jgi:hypothetical protein
MTRVHFGSLFFDENQTGEYGLLVLARRHSLSYVDEQNRQAVPAVWFAVERDF